MRAHELGRALPPVNDYKDMLTMVCDLPTSNAYFIDMPRALKKDQVYDVRLLRYCCKSLHVMY